jgi:hypothetical protein
VAAHVDSDCAKTALRKTVCSISPGSARLSTTVRENNWKTRVIASDGSRYRLPTMADQNRRVGVRQKWKLSQLRE